MLFSRRQVIEAGAVTGALVAMPSRLLASVVDPLTPVRSVPAQPRIAVDPVIDPHMVARARAAFDRHRGSLAYIDVVGIVDFGKASADPRFFLLDTNSGRVTRHLVAHGRGSDPDHTGFLQRFSNQPGSEASSNGAYVTGDFYPGHYGRAMRLRGLDGSNSNAESRAIVVHSAWYAEPNVLATSGRLGRSEGCFALPYAGLQEVMQRLGPGRFLYADRLA
jgi:hypothetical protein